MVRGALWQVGWRSLLTIIVSIAACGPKVGALDSGESEEGTTGSIPMASDSGQASTLPAGDRGTDVGEAGASTGGDDTSGGVVGDTSTASADNASLSSSGDASAGDRSSGDGSSGDGSTGDGSSGDGSSGDGSTGIAESSTGDSNPLCDMPPPTASCDAYASDLDVFAALGLGCEGDDDGNIPLLGSIFGSPDGDAWAVATQFGTATDALGEPVWGPRQGDSFLVISNGNDIIPDGFGALTLDGLTVDANDNPDGGPPPAPIVSAKTANDLVWMQFSVDVPADVSGFSLDVAFFSEEYPEWVGTSFNDVLYVWADSGPFSDNLCTTGDSPCTVTSTWPTPFMPGADELAGTGFENDGATSWLTLRGPADPGGTLEVTIALFDVGDMAFTTLALLDAFRWECEGCDPTAVPSTCGY